MHSNKLNEIYQFLALHKAFFALAAAWMCREWTSVNGWDGFKLWVKTGKITVSTTETVSNTVKKTETPSTATAITTEVATVKSTLGDVPVKQNFVDGKPA